MTYMAFIEWGNHGNHVRGKNTDKRGQTIVVEVLNFEDKSMQIAEVLLLKSPKVKPLGAQ